MRSSLLLRLADRARGGALLRVRHVADVLQLEHLRPPHHHRPGDRPGRHRRRVRVVQRAVPVRGGLRRTGHRARRAAQRDGGRVLHDGGGAAGARQRRQRARLLHRVLDTGRHRHRLLHHRPGPDAGPELVSSPPRAGHRDHLRVRGPRGPARRAGRHLGARALRLADRVDRHRGHLGGAGAGRRRVRPRDAGIDGAGAGRVCRRPSRETPPAPPRWPRSPTAGPPPRPSAPRSSC